MNQTVIVDDAYRARQFENRLNVVFRHCRVGKVVSKRTSVVPSPIPFRASSGITPDRWKMWPFNDDASAPSQQYMSKCGCKVGTACGNVACPHRLVATC